MMKYDFINWDSLSKSIAKLVEYWEKSSSPLLLRSLCSWNIPVGILEHSSTAPGLSNIHCNAQILSASLFWNPWRIAQLSIFGFPDCSVICKWVAETHLTHLRAAFRFLGMYIYLLSCRIIIPQNYKKISLSFLQGSRPNVIHPLWLPSIRFDCSSKYKDELCHLIFISSPPCVALSLWMSNPSWKYICLYVVLLVHKLSWHLEIFSMPSTSLNKFGKWRT